MAPHSMNDNQGNDANHRRAKSNRVAPAIPYALVKPKPKAGPSKESSIAPNVAKSSTSTSLGAAQEASDARSMSPAQDKPMPAALATSHEQQSLADCATPTDNLSDRNIAESEDSKRSVVSSATSPPSTEGTTSPGPTRGQSGKPFLHSSATSASITQGAGFSSDPKSPNGHPTAQASFDNKSRDISFPQEPGFTNGHKHDSKKMSPIQPPNGAQVMQIDTAVVPTPSGIMSPIYPADFMSPSITSPISGWNPNANFVPPSHQMHVSRRSMHGTMSPRTASHHSSASDARVPKLVSPMSFTQPLPPIDIFPWSSYINTFYSNSRFADFSLVPAKVDRTRGAPEFPAHGLIISKSSTLSHLISSLPNNPRRNDSGQTYLSLAFDEKLTTYRAILEAIGHLYGQPLPHYGEGLPMSIPADVILERMTSALTLAGAGQYLCLPEVMSHGLAFAIDFITWQTFEKALAFAQASMNTLSSFHEADNRSNEMIKVMYHYHSSLLFRLERFLVDNFPKRFQFLASSPELSEARRLPASIETRPSISHARLASIQFGDMPTQDPALVQSDSMLSSILLSIPIAILARLSELPELAKKLGRPQFASILREVIDERERRRIEVAKGKRFLPSTSSIQAEELKWAEVLQPLPQSLLGVVVARIPADQDH